MSAVTGIIIVYDACDCRCICMYSACECECEFQGVATRFIAIPSRRFPQELMTSDLVIYSPSSSHGRSFMLLYCDMGSHQSSSSSHVGKHASRIVIL